VNGTEDVRGSPDVVDREVLVDLHGVVVVGALEGFQRLGVVGAPGDRLLEDRGIGGHTAEAVLVDQPLDATLVDQVAAEVVEPDGLSELLESQQGIRGSSSHRSLLKAAQALSNGSCHEPNGFTRSSSSAGPHEPAS